MDGAPAMCSFDSTFSPEHEESLVCIVREMTYDTEIQSVFAGALLQLLENISGFEVMDESRSQQIVNYFWSKYRGKETDRIQVQRDGAL